VLVTDLAPMSVPSKTTFDEISLLCLLIFLLFDFNVESYLNSSIPPPVLKDVSKFLI
jgi:hypothetical protein